MHSPLLCGSATTLLRFHPSDKFLRIRHEANDARLEFRRNVATFGIGGSAAIGDVESVQSPVVRIHQGT